MWLICDSAQSGLWRIVLTENKLEPQGFNAHRHDHIPSKTALEHVLHPKCCHSFNNIFYRTCNENSHAVYSIWLNIVYWEGQYYRRLLQSINNFNKYFKFLRFNVAKYSAE